MKTITSRPVETDSASPKRRVLDPIGLTIVAGFPAMFWTAAIGLAAKAAGLNLSMTALALIAGAIGVFLTAVYAAIVAAANVTITQSRKAHRSTAPATAQPPAFSSASTNPAR